MLLTSEDDCAGAALEVQFVISPTAASTRLMRRESTHHSTKEGRVDGAEFGHDEWSRRQELDCGTAMSRRVNSGSNSDDNRQAWGTRTGACRVGERII